MARKREGMDKQLFEETKKRFQTILEYTVIGGTMDEADDDNQQDVPPQDDMQGAAPMPPQGGDMGGGDMGAPPPMGGPQGGADQGMPPMDGQQGDQGMPPQGEQAPQGPAGFDPQGDMGGGDMTQADFAGDQPAPEDDVVDITDLTDAQEDTQKDIEKLDNKFGAIMKQLGAFEELIKDNDAKIEDLKAEFERRNPTQVEKLSMNTAKGGPFTVSPEEYWDEKEATSNYSTEDDDNGKEQGQYVITANDVNGAVDWHNIARSLGDDFIMHQTLNEALKY